MSTRDNSNHTTVWLGLMTFTWSMLFVWQGLDFTDMGFWLTGYQQFYTHPDTILATCWLSSFIGHWTGITLGQGVLAYKLGYLVVITTSAIITYRLLASQLGHSRMLASMVLLTVFFTRGYAGNWIGYNELTALFYLAGAAFLFFSLIGNLKLLVVLAGAVLGANVFVRLPNLLGITLVSAIWLHGWAYQWSIRNILVWTILFFGGFTLGITLISGLIVLHGHQDIYFQGIQALFDLAVDSESHHSGSGLLKVFIKDHIKAFSEAFLILLIGGLLANWASKQKKLFTSTIILISAIILFYIFYIQDNWRWSITGLCYVVLLSIVFLKAKKDNPIVLLAFVAGMILLVTPLGSNRGITNSVFGMWLALPLTLTWLWRTPGFTFSCWLKTNSNGLESNGMISLSARGFRVLTTTIILSVLISSLVGAWRYTYKDSKNRFTMSHSIANALLFGTYTTTDRAKVTQELLDAMPHFIKPGDEVLAYNAIPTLHYLSKTHPWLGIPWPDFIDSKKLTSLIKQKELTDGKLPCIIRAKGSTYTNSWPIDAQPLATFLHQGESRRVFSEFEQRHGYKVTWSNEFFEILITPE
jgi:hypothetical protein